MKRSLRRIVSWLCVLSLCLSLLPGTAWAAGEEDSPVGPNESVTLTVGDKITPKWSPNADGADQETWESDDETVATVDANGDITAEAKGEAIITHTYYVVEEVEEPAAPIEGGDEPDSKSNAETSFAESDAEHVEEPVEDLDGDAGDTTVNSAGEVELTEESAEQGNVDADTAESSGDTLEDEPGTDDATTLVYKPKTETVTVTVEAPVQYVAQIVGTDKQYETLDEAVKAAEEGATIELLADATTAGLNLSKELTIRAAEGLEETPTITFTQYGIALWGKALTFKDVDIVMKGIGSTPYIAEWYWMTIGASAGASLTLDNVDMMMDGTGTAKGESSTHAIYFTGNNKLNLVNKSVLEIKNYSQDALEWDGGNGGYNVNITNSTFISDHNRSGFTGTFYATITNSKVDVINSTGNGSNGSHFIIKNSEVDFSDNGSHGLSAGELVIDGSVVTADNNHGMGITVNNDFTIKNNSTVTVTGNADNASYGYAAVRLYNDFTFTVDNTSKLYIKDNNNTGLYVRQGKLNVANGAILEITGNIVNNNLLNGYGGGIYLGYGDNYDPTVSLPADAVIYNNHSLTGGDDIYISQGVNGPNLIFGEVGDDWHLDGDPDCKDLIDGWYDDSEDSRWEAHSAPTHAEEVRVGDYPASGPLALKAAHGVIPLEPGDIPEGTWEKSKSKTATNLDENFESQVTLSLPAESYKPTVDVVMVIDVSSSMKDDDIQEAKQAATAMCEELAAKANVTTQIGIVTFDKDAHLLTNGLVSIEEAKTEIEQIEASSDTNMMAGLMAGKEMLDSGAGNEKYLVLMSDGIPTYWVEDGQPTSKTLVRYEKDKETVIDQIPAGTEPEASENNIDSMLTMDEILAISDWNSDSDEWWQVSDTGESFNPDYKYTNIQKATYKTAEYLIENIFGEYQIKMVAFGTDKYKNNVVYQYGENFCDWIGEQSGVSYYKISKPGYGGETGELKDAFKEIADEMVHLLDAGSTVKDYMGYEPENYNFDFVNDPEYLTLTVGGVEYEAVSLTNGVYGFGEESNGTYPFKLEYFEGDGREQEYFVWYINVPVTIDSPVQLTYTVKLVNPKTEPGTYGEYDEKGDGINDITGEEVVKNSLYTNNSATLYPVDSNGEDGIPESFPKPTVSYTVAEEAGVGALTISKTVEGMSEAEAQGHEFEFTVTFSNGGSYDYFFSDSSKPGGTITSGGMIKLKSGETVSISGIPAGTGYSVSETAAEGFVTTVENNDGPAIATTYSEGAVTAIGTIRGGGIASAAHFVNTYTAPGVPGLNVTKSVDKTAASVGETLTYTIVVANTGTMPLAGVTVTDTMTEGRAVTWGTLPEGVTANADNTLTIASLAPGAFVRLTATYAVTEDDLGDTIVNIAAAAVPGGPTDDETVTTTVDDGGFSVKITPADITIYTGGDAYGGITDANGNIIEEASGLPEPGYHLILSAAVEVWLTQQGFSENTAARLDEILRFEYYDASGNAVRRWKLEYQGVYSRRSDGTVSQYVYSLTPNLIEGPNEGTEVRLQYTDPDNQDRPMFDDDILMTENLASDKYDMTIYDGGLNQRDIVAVLEVKEQSIPADVEIGTGTLTIRTVTDEGTTTTEIQESAEDVRGGDITAVADGVTYYVNNSEVEVNAGRVQLLVDEVSNNNGFDREMARDAIDHAISETPLTSRDNLSYDMAYMDLVDTRNGNAVVTMGENDSLTIYWPMPNDAENREGDRVYIIHYVDMDRETTYDDLSEAAKDILYGTVVELDGELYAEFDVNSFSPFVLVYEEEDNDRPTRPDPDPDDDKDDEDEEPEEDVTGLNTTDHYAYIAGYEDGTVRPDGNITRAEVATIFFRLMTDEYRETCWSTSSGFTDVTAANWYNNAISTTANAGWVSGYPDGTFRPDAYITRAEFATIAARFLSDVYGGTSMFTDISGHWAEDYINRAAAAGWINGYADGTFRPNAYITRAEAVTLINRMLDRAPDANHLLADMVRWPDNPETAWYYADIQEATNSHDYTRAGTGNYEVWTELLANRDWAALEEIWSQANDAPGGEVMG